MAELPELRQSLHPNVNILLSDADCNRFLNARNKNVAKAVEMINKWTDWRRNLMEPMPPKDLQFSPNIITCNPDPCYEHPFIHLLPACMHGFDKEGNPIYWERTGYIQANFSKIKDHFTLSELIQFHIAQQEAGETRYAYASKISGKDITQTTIVMDFKHLTMSLDVQAISYMRKALEIDQNYYPERLKRLLILNAPWYFTTLYAMFKPLIDKRTSDKFLFLGSDVSKMEEYIDKELIPIEMGGTVKGFPWGKFGDSDGIDPNFVGRLLDKYRPDMIQQLLTPEEVEALLKALEGHGETYQDRIAEIEHVVYGKDLPVPAVLSSSWPTTTTAPLLSSPEIREARESMIGGRPGRESRALKKEGPILDNIEGSFFPSWAAIGPDGYNAAEAVGKLFDKIHTHPNRGQIQDGLKYLSGRSTKKGPARRLSVFSHLGETIDVIGGDVDVPLTASIPEMVKILSADTPADCTHATNVMVVEPNMFGMLVARYQLFPLNAILEAFSYFLKAVDVSNDFMKDLGRKECASLLGSFSKIIKGIEVLNDEASAFDPTRGIARFVNFTIPLDIKKLPSEGFSNIQTIAYGLEEFSAEILDDHVKGLPHSTRRAFCFRWERATFSLTMQALKAGSDVLWGNKTDLAASTRAYNADPESIQAGKVNFPVGSSFILRLHTKLYSMIPMAASLTTTTIYLRCFVRESELEMHLEDVAGFAGQAANFFVPGMMQSLAQTLRIVVNLVPRSPDAGVSRTDPTADSEGHTDITVNISGAMSHQSFLFRFLALIWERLIMSDYLYEQFRIYAMLFSAFGADGRRLLDGSNFKTTSRVSDWGADEAGRQTITRKTFVCRRTPTNISQSFNVQIAAVEGNFELTVKYKGDATWKTVRSLHEFEALRNELAKEPKFVLLPAIPVGATGASLLQALEKLGATIISSCTGENASSTETVLNFLDPKNRRTIADDITDGKEAALAEERAEAKARARAEAAAAMAVLISSSERASSAGDGEDDNGNTDDPQGVVRVPLPKPLKFLRSYGIEGDDLVAIAVLLWCTMYMRSVLVGAAALLLFVYIRFAQA